MKIRIVNLWKKENRFPKGSDFFTLDILSFSLVDCQLGIVIFNFSLIFESVYIGLIQMWG